MGADNLWVMEKLEHWSWRACSIRVLMSTEEEEFVTFCQRCWCSQWPPQSACLDHSWNLLAIIAPPLLPARPPNPPASDTSINLVIPLLAAPSRTEAYIALVPNAPLSTCPVSFSADPLLGPVSLPLWPQGLRDALNPPSGTFALLPDCGQGPASFLEQEGLSPGDLLTSWHPTH